MATRYKKNKRKNVSVYIWSIVIILLTAGAAGAGAWLGVYAAQQSASQPVIAEETGGITVAEETEETGAEEEQEQPVSEEEIGEEPVTDHSTTEEPIEEEPITEEPITEEPAAEEEPVDRTIYPEEIEPPAQPTFIQGILLANKQYPLPEDYAPGENAEARAAFERMAAAAEEEGIELVAFSTYRSFARQKELYEGYAARDGAKAADRYSARPGHSEHQTGLAFDIGEAGQEEHWGSSSFAETAGGKWLADNAHKFGFILRYPEGKEKVTGYMFESWHFRYVGEKDATAIYEQGLTLEEYLDL